jgi:hypothetical protein
MEAIPLAIFVMRQKKLVRAGQCAPHSSTQEVDEIVVVLTRLVSRYLRAARACNAASRRQCVVPPGSAKGQLFNWWPEVLRLSKEVE